MMKLEGHALKNNVATAATFSNVDLYAKDISLSALFILG